MLVQPLPVDAQALRERAWPWQRNRAIVGRSHLARLLQPAVDDACRTMVVVATKVFKQVALELT